MASTASIAGMGANMPQPDAYLERLQLEIQILHLLEVGLLRGLKPIRSLVGCLYQLEHRLRVDLHTYTA